ncbi:pyridoxal phosphate-dependent aminotransferase [Staphylococcus saprophyticus]|uniref:pyridoxal phosphate-dependent aminotransferase n=1 Tax=Staphylococcus saprophyticus TaxID=29385 RepID=UPI00289EF599|nr:pyridoxal phosphate-dependent aminotransferase [Staphylococcus saprophyticus]
MNHSNNLTFEDFFQQVEKNSYSGENKIIDLGQGNPKIQIPEKVINRFCKYLQDSMNHKYPNNIYLKELKFQVQNLYKNKFFTEIDVNNIGVYNGAKKIFYLLFNSLLDNRSNVLLIDPAYPDYEKILLSITQNIVKLPVYNNLPDTREIENIVKKHNIDLIVFNYPNNPTGVIANSKFWNEINILSEKYDIFVVNDFTYSDYVFGDFFSPSLLQDFQTNHKLIEVYSFSKNFTIPGWRIASIIANNDIINCLTEKDNLMEIGMFNPIVKTLNYILSNYKNSSFVTSSLYQENMEYVKNKLSTIENWEITIPNSGMFLWIYIGEHDSWNYFLYLLHVKNIIILPGLLYGENYRNYIRLSMNTTFKEIDDLVERIKS